MVVAKCVYIKKRMEAGTYQVSSKDIADKVVNRYFDSIF